MITTIVKYMINKMNKEKLEHFMITNFDKMSSELKETSVLKYANFILKEKFVENYDYVRIILGSCFLVEKNKQQEYLAELFANIQTIGNTIPKYPNLSRLLFNGCLEFRTPFGILDHRKMYLLKADDGRTRVIKPSANASEPAWNNSHIENYDYDDTLFCYEECLKDFETAWQFSQPVPFEVFTSTTKNDVLKGDIVIRKIKETNETIVLQEIEPKMSFENIKYTMEKNLLKNDYKEILASVDLNSKDGFIKITPNIVKKIEHNKKKFFQQKVEFHNVEKAYPELTYDLSKKECCIDGEPINLYPTGEEINDINELIGIFNNFNEFVGDVEELKKVHFKLMNAIFCSPFNARLRCDIKIKGISSQAALPLFALISSETSGSGKTFMMKAILKMMTVKELNIVKGAEFKKDDVRKAQIVCKGFPFFIDEINNHYMSTIKDIIKNPEKCEDNQLRQMPMLLFASNEITRPEEFIRKRMVFFLVNCSLPSTIDKVAYDSRSKAIIKRLGTGLYREYFRRMMDEVKEQLDFIIYSNNIPDDYYLDLMAISSNVILSILKDYGYEIPNYMSHLTWHKDYSSDSNANNIVQEIGEFCKNNKNMCYLTKDKVIIKLSLDNESKKKAESWKNMFPNEINTQLISNQKQTDFIIERKKFEERLGYKLKGKSFFTRR